MLGGFRYDNANSRDNLTDTDTNEDDAVTPRFGLLWQPIPQLSLYGNYLENFGGSNGRAFDLTPLPPESGQQWEVGVKTELFDGRLTGSLAWFDLTKQNIAVPDPGHPDFNRVLGEARNRGLEIGIAGELLPGWKVIASGAYNDAVVTEDNALDFDNLDANGNPTVTPGNTGRRFFGVPRFGGSLWSTYELQHGAWQGLTVGAGMVARSQQENSLDESTQIPGYVTVNLAVGYERNVGKSKISVQFNVDNLLDKDYFLVGDGTFAGVGTPRSFLGSIRVEF